MSIRGIDISAYQPSIDWAAVKASDSVGFCFAKATEGVDYATDTYKEQHDGCKAHDIPFGAYHFWKPSEDPVVQANFFLAAIDGYSGTLLPMVDVEVSQGLSSDELIASLSKFLQTVEASLGGKKCIIYSGYAFWNEAMAGTDAFSGHPFWVAEYNDGDAPALPNGFTNYAIWQFTDSYSVPGIGNVDGDKLNGTDLSIIER